MYTVPGYHKYPAPTGGDRSDERTHYRAAVGACTDDNNPAAQSVGLSRPLREGAEACGDQRTNVEP